ncbi:MAG: hypothetical protein AABX88_02295 [Nanoarchaeota archaeon]
MGEKEIKYFGIEKPEDIEIIEKGNVVKTDIGDLVFKKKAHGADLRGKLKGEFVFIGRGKSIYSNIGFSLDIDDIEPQEDETIKLKSLIVINYDSAKFSVNPFGKDWIMKVNYKENQKLLRESGL